MIRAIFFDQDNTLVNTRVVAAGVYKSAIGNEEDWKKWQETVERLKESKNPTERTFEYSLMMALGNKEKVDRILKIYRKELVEKIELCAGVKEFFEGPKMADYYVLVTENFGEQIEMYLGKFNLKEKFDLIVSSEDVGVMKPDIGYYKLAWDRLGLDPSECLYVGDNYEKDCRLGVEAGGRGVVFGRDIQDMRELGGMI